MLEYLIIAAILLYLYEYGYIHKCLSLANSRLCSTAAGNHNDGHTESQEGYYSGSSSQTKPATTYYGGYYDNFANYMSGGSMSGGIGTHENRTRSSIYGSWNKYEPDFRAIMAQVRKDGYSRNTPCKRFMCSEIVGEDLREAYD